MRAASAAAAGALAALAALIPQAAACAPYAIDPTHTFINFEVPHRGTSLTRGRWDRKQGSVEFDREARTGRAEITIDMASVSTGVPALDEALRGKEAFDTAAHPTARFVGERFVFERDRVARVQGQLSLRGVTHPVTLEARRFDCYTSPLLRREVCGGDFEVIIERSRWGIGFGLPVAAPDPVRLLIQVEAIRQ